MKRNGCQPTTCKILISHVNSSQVELAEACDYFDNIFDTLIVLILCILIIDFYLRRCSDVLISQPPDDLLDVICV